MLSERERDFSWRDGERLIRFGGGALTEAPELLTKHGFEGYVLLCTRRALDSADRAGALAEGAEAVLEVPSGGVPDAAASVRGQVGGRPLVALGGGRVLDSAKAIAAVDGLRCAAVPTTLSGAEVTTIHRLPSGAERAGLVRPALVIADPELMASAPTPALTATAMNALAHGAEALYAPGANPVGELAALRGAELIAAGLETPEPDRESLALGALLCAWAIDGAGLGMHHALCQTIVRLTGAAHAETNAVVLPAVLRYLAPHVRRELGRLAAALGADDDDPQLAAERAGALAAGTKVAGLSELGVREDQLEAVIEAVLRRPELAGAPGSPGSEEVRKLLSGVL
ncbi:MAG: iron-containing alcohol dehydrogenase [Actinomycetota bacterium]|nr:iron-containing alcohol dehydrogenase [Actinomycetota bacterium]